MGWVDQPEWVTRGWNPKHISDVPEGAQRAVRNAIEAQGAAPTDELILAIWRGMLDKMLKDAGARMLEFVTKEEVCAIMDEERDRFTDPVTGECDVDRMADATMARLRKAYPQARF